jgi:uncharacterized protein YggE
MEGMKTIQIAVAAMVVLAVAALVGIGRPEAAGGASDTPSDGITVTGTGHAKAVPDEAEFSMGISSEGETAGAALRANSVQIRRLIAALKGAGISPSDIRTQDVSVGRSYDENGEPDGFAAHNSVSVHLEELGRAGELLDAASRAGAEEITGPSLTRSNRDTFETRALEDAVVDARGRAKALAAAAGVSLGEVTAIVESPQAVEPVYRAAELAKDAQAPIEPGTEDVTAVVTVTFAIA